ncbi:hypothetical protein [Streptomyces sp. NPDC050388]|uniref:hypothetical protein n=1 Tax=Streptomyces sp. NPDC050388 TaxID=3155781 RepID=UPI00341496F5
MRASRPEPCPLTGEEAEALRLAAAGATAREIAADLFFGVGTVRNRSSAAHSNQQRPTTAIRSQVSAAPEPIV